MRAPYNPSADDITHWASDPAATEPAQDWDLILSHFPYETLYMRLASTKDCPKQDYFLSLLYLIVGDAVRTEYRTRSREDVERLLAEAELRFPAYPVHTWVQRSRALIAGEQPFSYEDWCAGVLARRYDG